jgi:hypothetical protein
MEAAFELVSADQALGAEVDRTCGHVFCHHTFGLGLAGRHGFAIAAGAVVGG